MAGVTLTPFALSALVLAAARHAIGLTSHLPTLVCEVLVMHADDLAEQTREILVREIRAAEAEGRLGAQVDAVEWRRAMRALLAASRRAA